MFDYKISKHPHFDEACRAFALRHNMAKLAERAGMNVQTLRNKLNPDQPHQLNASDIWLLTDLTEDSTLVDGFLAQIHCLPCVPINEVAKEKLPHYVMSATAEIGRVAAGAVSGDVKTSAGRRDAISSINSVTRLMALAAVSLQARLQVNPAMASAVDTVTGSVLHSVCCEVLMLTKEPSFASLLVKQSPAMHYGHGWIMGEDGKRWHPCRSQDELLAELSTKKRGNKWLLKALRRLFH